MAKFAFKLQPVLNVKEQLEDSLKNEFGKAVRQLEYEKEILAEIGRRQQHHMDEMGTRSGKGISVGELKMLSAYVSYLKDQMGKQKEVINNAQNNVDTYREKLVKAMQEKGMLEKLREKNYKEYQADQLKAEQKLNDEIVSFNHGRKESL